MAKLADVTHITFAPLAPEDIAQIPTVPERANVILSHDAWNGERHVSTVPASRAPDGRIIVYLPAAYGRTDYRYFRADGQAVTYRDDALVKVASTHNRANA